MNPKLLQGFQTLNTQKVALLKSLESYDNDRLNKNPQDGGWSPLQVLHHIMLVEKGATAYMQKKLEYKTRIPKASIFTHMRASLMNVGFKSPIKFRAPKVAAGVGENLDLYQLAQNWDKNRVELRQFLEDFPEDLIENCVFKHPLAGRITSYHALEFFSHHLDRHRRQIVRGLK